MKGDDYMITVYYERAGVEDIRCFKDLEELNDWLKRMKKLNEVYFITKIVERS